MHKLVFSRKEDVFCNKKEHDLLEIGTITFSNDSSVARGRRPYSHLLWVISGQLEIKCDRGVLLVDQFHFAFLIANRACEIKSSKPNTVVKFLSIDGRNSVNYVFSLGLWEGSFKLPFKYDKEFDILSSMLRDGDSRTCDLMDEFLTTIVEDLEANCESLLGLKVARYINLNYGDNNLNIASIANTFEVTQYSLSKQFKIYTKQGVSEYLNQLRLFKAYDYLDGGTYPIQAVASLCGFKNVSYFCTIFKQKFGRTPSDVIAANSPT